MVRDTDPDTGGADIGNEDVEAPLAVDGGPPMTDEEEFQQDFGSPPPEAVISTVLDAASIEESSDEAGRLLDLWTTDDPSDFAGIVAREHPEAASDISNAIYGLGLYLSDPPTE